jgi:hypothetical protein
MIIILIVVLTAIFLLEIPRLFNKSYFREIAVFLFFYIIGVYMSLAQFYGWYLYNPLQPLIALLAPLV